MSSASRFWNLIAGTYDEDNAQFRWNPDRSIEHARKYLRWTDMVLDCGCGTGTAAVEISVCAREIRAVDISANMLNAARVKAKARGIRNITFGQEDIFTPRLEKTPSMRFWRSISCMYWGIPGKPFAESMNC